MEKVVIIIATCIAGVIALSHVGKDISAMMNNKHDGDKDNEKNTNDVSVSEMSESENRDN